MTVSPTATLTDLVGHVARTVFLRCRHQGAAGPHALRGGENGVSRRALKPERKWRLPD